MNRTRLLRAVVRFDWFVDRSFWWAPIAGIIAMSCILAAEVTGAAAVKWVCAAALVGIVVGFFELIGAKFWLAGVIAFCRARRDGFVAIGLVRFALGVCVGGFFAVSGVLAVLRFAGL